MTKPKSVLAWHLVGDTLRDGSPVPADGVILTHPGEIEMCSSGFHSSRHPIDALGYAPGSMICRVRLYGDIDEGIDKLVASERKIIWRVDGTELLRDFARKCALDVIDLWAAPAIVREYLETGDESMRDAAWAAARAAAWAAARDAARDAAREKQNTRLEEMIIRAHKGETT